jgi:hypothetical protein
MADNYLEKKMEEHRLGAVKRSRTSGVRPSSGLKPGEVAVKFEPRRVFVTGGAQGIGRAIVKAFREWGSSVAFCDLDTKAGQRTAQEMGARFYPVDVRDVSALEKAFNDAANHFGDIDIVVNNVAVCDFKPLSDLSLDDFDNAMITNVRPIVVLARRMLLMRQGREKELNGYGRIINISSTRATMSERSTEAYSATKGAVSSLTHALMMSMAPVGVTVNAISPGWIETKDYASLRAVDHEFHPSHRVGRPEDIARMCLWLCHADNDFINGENITIDGGVTRMMLYPD